MLNFRAGPTQTYYLAPMPMRQMCIDLCTKRKRAKFYRPLQTRQCSSPQNSAYAICGCGVMMAKQLLLNQLIALGHDVESADQSRYGICADQISQDVKSADRVS